MVRTILQSRFPFLSNGTAPVFLRIFRWQDFFGDHGCSNIPVANRQDHREVSLYKSSATRTFCTIGDLSIKKCVPLNSNIMRPMTPEEANALIAKVPEWNLVNEDGVMKLHRSWKVKTFMRGLQFLQLVADVAEAEGHHPDLHLVGWNNVKIDIWTHSVGGLTENDFILAAKINGLNLHHLLSIAK